MCLEGKGGIPQVAQLWCCCHSCLVGMQQDWLSPMDKNIQMDMADDCRYQCLRDRSLLFMIIPAIFMVSS